LFLKGFINVIGLMALFNSNDFIAPVREFQEFKDRCFTLFCVNVIRKLQPTKQLMQIIDHFWAKRNLYFIFSHFLPPLFKKHSRATVRQCIPITSQPILS